VQRLAATRRTFTEEEALAPIWEERYNVSPQDDTRFVLGREADGRAPRHWHLVGQVVANNRLIEALEAGTWDGRDVDAELARLDQENGGHHVFCPADERLMVHPDGRIDLADDERDLVLPPDVQSALDALAERVLERWRAAGPVPWTARQVTEALADLGWERARARGGWVQVRGWLRAWTAVARVGRDYWLPADALPSGPARTRLSVIRVRGESSPDAARGGEGAAPSTAGVSGGGRSDPLPAELTTAPAGASTRWTTALRTVNLLEGFLPVPAAARAAYPPAPRGGGRWEVLRGQWFETGEPFWVWLDRERDLLCGPELAERLAWREAGERFEITWAAECLVFRPAGTDSEVQREETRLADAETLAGLRGGPGESYRQSVTAVLADQPSGLPFRDLLAAVRARQGHDVHRGTLRAVLYAGGFVCRDGRWQAGPDEGRSRRLFREAVVLAAGDGPSREAQGHPPRAVASLRLRLRWRTVAGPYSLSCAVPNSESIPDYLPVRPPRPITFPLFPSRTPARPPALAAVREQGDVALDRYNYLGNTTRVVERRHFIPS
jgi:hypothetical protein